MTDDPFAHKRVETDPPIHELLARRFSPCCFADEPVAEEDLRALFEAARWAPSSYNEQPWRFVVARRHEEPEVFARFVEALVEANRTWARHAPVLALAAAARTFERNGAPNRHAFHDVGLALAQLAFEATARGLGVHCMAGFDPGRIAEATALPEGIEPVCMFALGRPHLRDDLPESARQRDLAPRSRRPLDETLFLGAFGRPLDRETGAPGRPAPG